MGFTNQIIRELLPVMKAFAEGKTIQIRKGFSQEWKDIDCDDEISFNRCPSDYRIKTEFEYRPFATLSECWHEMHNHPDFGWLKSKHSDSFVAIAYLTQRMGDVRITFNFSESLDYKMDQVFNDYVFTDNTPFGIKKENSHGVYV